MDAGVVDIKQTLIGCTFLAEIRTKSNTTSRSY